MALQIQKNGETLTLRNLQEQVQKNKEDIARHYAIDRTLANLGITVVGRVETADQLPDPVTYTGNYGDAYSVGSEQDVSAGTSGFDFYVYTRPDLNSGHPDNYWLNIGKISIIGPQGPQGPQGIKGENGESSRWYASDNPPAGTNYTLGDMWLVTSGQFKGQVFYYNGTKWIGVTNITGPQGSQGPIGIQGPQGIQGIQGPKGDTGDVGGFINIWGIIENTAQLPTPDSLNNLSVAYLVGEASPYDLYIQVGTTPDVALWTNTGPFNAATLVRIAGVAQNVLDLDTYLFANVYNKSEIDTKLSTKADSNNVYNKLYVDTNLSKKANKSDVYTKQEEDVKFEEANQMFETLGNEIEKKVNAEYICKGTATEKISFSNTNPSKSAKAVIKRVGGMSYKKDGTIKNSEVTSITSKFGSNMLEIGAILSTGEDSELNTRIRIKQTQKIYLEAGTYEVLFTNLEKFVWYGYTNANDTAANYNISAAWQDVGTTITLTDDCYVRFAFKYNDNRVITNANELTYLKLVKNNVSIYPLFKSLITIPTAIQNLAGYGWGINNTCYNYIDFETKKFVLKVGRINLGSLSWIKNAATPGGVPFTYFEGSTINPTATGNYAPMLCANYPDITWNQLMNGKRNGLYIASQGTKVIINDTNYDNVTANDFKSAMNGVYLYYALATPIETDISSYITKDILDVVEGGTLEFTNAYSQAVPNVVEYIFNAVTLKNVVDSNGNPRFIGGNGNPITVTGLTFASCKWVLNGTNLIFEIAGTVTKKMTIPNTTISTFTLPAWIYNKIIPAAQNIIDLRKYDINYTNGEISTIDLVISKSSDNKISFTLDNRLTTLDGVEGYFRFAFNTIIDNE